MRIRTRKPQLWGRYARILWSTYAYFEAMISGLYFRMTGDVLNFELPPIDIYHQKGQETYDWRFKESLSCAARADVRGSITRPIRTLGP